MIKFAIVDDEPNTTILCQNLISNYYGDKEVLIDKFYDIETIIKRLETTSYDVIFLDIQIKSDIGIEIADYIRNDIDDEKTRIIFMSSYTEYAMDLFKVRPTDFIVKPLNQEKINKSLKIIDKLISKDDKYFKFIYNRNSIKIPVNKIIYFVSEGNRININTTDKHYYFYDKMDNIEGSDVLINFYRISKSYLVNPKFIIKQNSSKITLKSKIELNISRNYKKGVLKKMMEMAND